MNEAVFAFFEVVVVIAVPILLIVWLAKKAIGKPHPRAAGQTVAVASPRSKRTSRVMLVGIALWMPFGLLFAPFKYFWDRRK